MKMKMKMKMKSNDKTRYNARTGGQRKEEPESKTRKPETNERVVVARTYVRTHTRTDLFDSSVPGSVCRSSALFLLSAAAYRYRRSSHNRLRRRRKKKKKKESPVAAGPSSIGGSRDTTTRHPPTGCDDSGMKQTVIGTV